MRWPTPQAPQHGDIRERVVFAWLPKQCEDGMTRWLERLLLVETYCLPIYVWRQKYYGNPE